ncbi:glutaredoxin 3 [Terrarubrum flagellatum]|uniref:glutaredoxin 3 n=1 Tax=Terrirubrum flagellatum TaxID=2895980 RepID=UPI003144DE34
MPPVTIYSRSWCSYCHAAKDLLTRKGVAFEDIDIEKHPEARAVMVERAGGRTSVPQIFVGDAHIGGCDDLYALDRRGEFEPMLAT